MVRTDHAAEVALDEKVRRAGTEDVVVIGRVVTDDVIRVIRRVELRQGSTSLASVVGSDVVEVLLRLRRQRLRATPGYKWPSAVAKMCELMRYFAE